MFVQILNENPQYRNMANGPVIAMREMEARMMDAGYTPEQIVAAERRGRAAEKERQARVAVASTKGKNPPPPTGNTVTLTKDQLEFCKEQGLDPKEYAREVRNLELQRKGMQS